MPRIAEAAVERARLTVVPRRRVRGRPGAVRRPWCRWSCSAASIGLLLFNTSMQQASFAATSLEDQASTALGARADAADGARRAAQPPARRRAGPADGHGHRRQPGLPAASPTARSSARPAPPDPARERPDLPAGPEAARRARTRRRPTSRRPAPRTVRPGLDRAGSRSRPGHGASATLHGHRDGRNDAASHQNHQNHKNQQSHQR